MEKCLTIDVVTDSLSYCIASVCSAWLNSRCLLPPQSSNAESFLADVTFKWSGCKTCMFRGEVLSSGHLWGGLSLSLDLCLCTVNFRGFLEKFLRVDAYTYFSFSDTLGTIKELLWQTTLRTNKNFFKPPKTHLPHGFLR